MSNVGINTSMYNYKRLQATASIASCLHMMAHGGHSHPASTCGDSKKIKDNYRPIQYLLKLIHPMMVPPTGRSKRTPTLGWKSRDNLEREVEEEGLQVEQRDAEEKRK